MLLKNDPLLISSVLCVTVYNLQMQERQPEQTNYKCDLEAQLFAIRGSPVLFLSSGQGSLLRTQ